MLSAAKFLEILDTLKNCGAAHTTVAELHELLEERELEWGSKEMKQVSYKRGVFPSLFSA